MKRSEMTKAEEAAYDLGLDDGEEHAIGCCFGSNPRWRDFDTQAEVFAYDLGRERGYASVD